MWKHILGEVLAIIESIILVKMLTRLNQGERAIVIDYRPPILT
jgi:hypothetical protein